MAFPSFLCATLRFMGHASAPTWPSIDLCTRYLNEREIEIYGDGHQLRDFTFVSDVIDALS